MGINMYSLYILFTENVYTSSINNTVLKIKVEYIKKTEKNIRDIYTPYCAFCTNTNNNKLETNNK